MVAEVYLMSPKFVSEDEVSVNQASFTRPATQAKAPSQAEEPDSSQTQKNQGIFRKPEIVITPRLPKIPITEPLPADLASSLKRTKNLTLEQSAQLEYVLRKHHDVFTKDNDSFGACPWEEFEINTGKHPPIKQAARPIPIYYREALRQIITKWLETGAIVPSESPWASPILCVRKKDGSISLC